MRRRRMLAEINVVPYIDVMLVLLVIIQLQFILLGLLTLLLLPMRQL
mgnify:CR=1 FL=1